MKRRRLAREAIANAPPRVNKMNAKRVELEGHWFDSKIEATAYVYLRNLEAKGDIRSLKVHPFWYFKHPVNDEYLRIRSARYKGGRKVRYTADFSFIDGDGFQAWDVKGMDTGESRLRRALLELFHGISVKVVRREDLRGADRLSLPKVPR